MDMSECKSAPVSTLPFDVKFALFRDRHYIFHHLKFQIVRKKILHQVVIWMFLLSVYRENDFTEDEVFTFT